MIAGRKLLLADDSAAIQKVIELTFADEGMQVFSVGNGRLALETLEQVAPDVVLADVFMPELNGYDLCRSIKQNERFARTPVMLLVSSFEPFDEDEARRAGADDIVAKPFQSIRQLVSRVGTLLGKSESGESQSSLSTLGLSTADSDSVTESEPVVMTVESEEPPVTVLVEAPVLETHEVDDTQGPSCSADVELQTADTQPLERITDEPVEAAEEWQLQDTVEIEPAVSEVHEVSDASADTFEDYIIATEVSEITPLESATQESATQESVTQESAAQESTYQAMPETFEYSAPPPAPVIDEYLLDVEEEFVTADSDDVVLDLEFENAIDEAPVEVAYPPVVESSVTEVEWQAREDNPPAAIVSNVPAAEPVAPHNLSSVEAVPADAIDAIARRVVEQMSEKVVREIAWEVVPELSELLIKQKLNDQR
ncbi:MAG TPA: response regulator [Pyrinomonadaceae bacterium]|nr:response regulator [Pyrinomonadaceae bacterium]